LFLGVFIVVHLAFVRALILAIIEPADDMGVVGHTPQKKPQTPMSSAK
jgi:chemotaxis response regulator CheB